MVLPALTVPGSVAAVLPMKPAPAPAASRRGRRRPRLHPRPNPRPSHPILVSHPLPKHSRRHSRKHSRKRSPKAQPRSAAGSAARSAAFRATRGATLALRAGKPDLPRGAAGTQQSDADGARSLCRAVCRSRCRGRSQRPLRWTVRRPRCRGRCSWRSVICRARGVGRSAGHLWHRHFQPDNEPDVTRA